MTACGVIAIACLEKEKEDSMLYITAIVLLVLWAIGFLAFHVGGLIHLLIALAVIALLFQMFSGRRSLA
jgi:uncharacterized protein DUF5670